MNRLTQIELIPLLVNQTHCMHASRNWWVLRDALVFKRSCIGLAVH